MAVQSKMMSLGTKAPDFKLTDTVSGQPVSIGDFDDKSGLLVMFICNHCPYVQHVRDQLASLGRDYQDSDLAIVAISSNDADAYPTDSPKAMKTEAETHGYLFPYLYDEDQSVAASYAAMCTPDFFLFDGDRSLVYRGRLDESRPKSDVPVTGEDLRAAIEATLAGKPVAEKQHPPMGCSIKWKPGNEPAYLIS